MFSKRHHSCKKNKERIVNKLNIFLQNKKNLQANIAKKKPTSPADFMSNISPNVSTGINVKNFSL